MWELEASRYDKNNVRRCANIFHYREPHSENFLFRTILNPQMGQGPLGPMGQGLGPGLGPWTGPGPWPKWARAHWAQWARAWALAWAHGPGPGPNCPGPGQIRTPRCAPEGEQRGVRIQIQSGYCKCQDSYFLIHFLRLRASEPRNLPSTCRGLGCREL